MSKICPSCQTEGQDNQLFCPNCGARMVAQQPPAWQPPKPNWQSPPAQQQTSGWQPPSAQQQAPDWQPPQNPYNPGVGNSLASRPSDLLKVVSIALLVIAALNVIFGFVLLIGKFNVNVSATVSSMGLSESASDPIADIYDSGEFGGLHAINVIYGLVLLALGGFALYLWKEMSARSSKSLRLFRLFAIASIASVVVYLLLHLLLGSYSEEMYGITARVRVSPHFSVWIIFILNIATVVCNFLLLPKAKDQLAA